jgi:sialate O-acetylesterase
MRIYSKFADNALTAAAKPLQSFELAGADRKFHPAAASIDGGTVVVSSPEVREPVAVRYAWSDNPEANLYNGAGLPAAPFRSDNW